MTGKSDNQNSSEGGDRTSQLTTLREEIIRLRRENLDLKLKTVGDDEKVTLLTSEGLTAPYPEIQVLALSLISALPAEQRHRAIPAIVGVFPSLHESARSEAVSLLSRTEHPQAPPIVLGAANDSSVKVRAAVARELRRIAPEQSLSCLRTLLDDPDREVQIAAIDSIGVLRDRASADVLIQLVQSTDDDRLQERSLIALGSIGHAPAVDVLLEFLRTETTDGVRWAALHALGNLGVSEERVLSAITPYLQSDPLPIRIAAIEALGKLKARPTIPVLTELLKDPEPGIRLSSFTALHAIGGVDMLEPALLQAFAQEEDPGTAREEWNILIASAADDIGRTERLILLLSPRPGSDSQMAELAERLHQRMETHPEDSERTAALLLQIAQQREHANDMKEALEHYQRLLTRLPQRWDLALLCANCHVRLREPAVARRFLVDMLSKQERHSEGWWALQLAILELPDLTETPALILHAAFPNQAAATQSSDPRILQRLNAVINAAASALFFKLDDAKNVEQVQKDAIAIGRPLVPALAQALEKPDHSGHFDRLIAIGNSITATSFDPPTTATSEAKRREAATAWREWCSRP